MSTRHQNHVLRGVEKKSAPKQSFSDMISRESAPPSIRIRQKIWRLVYWGFQKFLRNHPQINYLYRTILILLTKGDCLFSIDLSLDSTHKYDSLFSKSEKQFSAVVRPFSKEFRWSLGRTYNGFFACFDAEVYYSMIRNFHPNTIIEVGSGNSTRFACDAIHKNGNGKIICIDPEPRCPLPSNVRYIQAKVEDADLSMFCNLNPGDILFIDSSHTEEEALYHVTKLLPLLKPGVLIHHHDISYPYLARCPEERVVLDFYRANSRNYSVLIGNMWLRHNHLDSVLALIPRANWFKKQPGLAVGSIWATKLS